jgi:hypothetical protein
MYKIVVYFEIAFVVEDMLLESLYLYYFWRYMQAVPNNLNEAAGKSMRITFYLLCLASIIVVLCDLAGLILLYMKVLLLRYTILGLLYATKLVTEFFVLNRLVDLVQMKNENLQRGNLSGATITNRIQADDLSSGFVMHSRTDRRCPAITAEGRLADLSMARPIGEAQGEEVGAHEMLTPTQGRLKEQRRDSDCDEVTDLERQYLGRDLTRSQYKAPA